MTISNALLAATVLLAAMPVEAMSFIRASNTPGDIHFYDESGRVRIFHGANRMEKNPVHQPTGFFEEMLQNDREFDLMQKMGFNVMRIGFMWATYNPAPGIFNQTYVDQWKRVLAKMSERGIYALLDMHEDVLSSKFCLYDGVPLWVINKSVPKHAFPWPLKGNCSSRFWAENTLSEAAATAYQDFYDNKNGMLDDLSDFWSHAAEQFKDEPGVIGYEIMNEPWPGNFYEDLSLFAPGVAGKKNLQRMYDTVAPAIRQHDDRHLIFYEPLTWGMIYNGKISGSGFSHVPGGNAYRNRSAYSYHYYCMAFVPSYEKKPKLTKVVCDQTIAPMIWKAVKQDLAKLGGAQMMTEGMNCPSSNYTECYSVMNSLDDNLFSWTDYGVSQDEKWDPDPVQQEAWARTYARAVAGQPLNMTFDHVTKDFNFCFTIDPSIQLPTEIFASIMYSYPGGANVVTTENLKSSVNGDIVSVEPKTVASTETHGCVHITRRSGPFEPQVYV